MISKERIDQLWKKADEEIIELWREGEMIIFREHFVRLIEKEIYDKEKENSRV